jgi:fructokinase
MPSGDGHERLAVVTCGELLIDFVAREAGALAEISTFERAAGGAPANVAVGLARLGHASGFLGQVGDDEFGHYLGATLASHGVDVSGLRFSRAARTALAFVSLAADGERDFLFYRHPSADTLWEAAADDLAVAARARIFHFGSITLIAEPSRSSTLAAARAAWEAGALISYDPNLRLPLWPSAEAARTGMLDGLRCAQIVKLSREELAFLVPDERDAAAAVRRLWAAHGGDGLRLVVVTNGRAGCAWFTADASGQVPGFTMRPVDTTGAGDGFVAGLLAGLLDADLSLEPASLAHALRLANAVGALTTTRRGAIPALPDRAAVEQLLRTT